MRRADAYSYPGSAWRTAFLGGYEFSEEGRLTLDAQTRFLFHATGGAQYRLHLPPDMPMNRHRRRSMSVAPVCLPLTMSPMPQQC